MVAEVWEAFREVEGSLQKPLFGIKSLLEGGHAIRDKLQASTKYSRRLPGLRRLHRKQKREQKLVIFFFYFFVSENILNTLSMCSLGKLDEQLPGTEH